MDFFTIVLIILFLLGIGFAYWLGSRLGGIRRDRYWEAELPIHRKDAISRSRAVLGGQFSEQLSPFLPGFKYLPTETRFIGKPIDLIVFKGMDDKDIKEIVFLEVKSGKSRLSSVEKKLKEAVNKGKVRWEEYRVPDELVREFEGIEDN